MDKIVPRIVVCYGICIISHYVASHLYVRVCCPNTVVGFMMSPFMTVSPHCQALRWTIYHGGDSIVAMWMVLGSYLVGRMKDFATGTTETGTTRTTGVEQGEEVKQ